MKSVIIAVSGSSRTGKDTLISKIGLALMGLSGTERVGGDQLKVISSIDPVKTFYRDMRVAAGLEPVGDDLSENDRIALAAIKEGLDRGFGFTSGYGDSLISNMDPGSVLLYQVREVGAINGLFEMANEAGHTYAVLWVHVQRRGENGHRGAPNDRYLPSEIASCDVLVQNTGLEDLDDWADLIARRVNKLRSS